MSPLKKWITLALLMVILFGIGIFVADFFKSKGEAIIVGRYCSPQEQSIRVFKCEQSVYLVSSLIPDVGHSYIDINGKDLATCGGNTNKTNPALCLKYDAYSCEKTKNLCTEK